MPERSCGDDPCNAQAGGCTALACLSAGALHCEGDVLQRCNDARSGFDVEDTCGAGLCDSVELACDGCVADNERCTSGSTRAVCDSQGHDETTTSCPVGQPICTGAGVCVQCTQAAQCSVPNDCYVASCNTGNGLCEPIFKGEDSACSGGYCTSAGACAQCTQSSQCTASGECMSASCETGSGMCQESPRAPLASCGSSEVCDGMGACVECISGAQCGSNEVCRASQCTGAVHSHGWENAAGSTASLVADYTYLKLLPDLAYDMRVEYFGIQGTATGSSARLALYADNGAGNGPTGNSLSEATTSLSASAVEVAAAPQVTLNAGTRYWLAVKVNTATSLSAATSTVIGRRILPPPYYADAFQTFTGAADPGSSHSAQFALYLRVRDLE